MMKELNHSVCYMKNIGKLLYEDIYFHICLPSPFGTGKTYLYRALLTNLRRMNHIVLATTSSGIAANILPGWRIMAHHILRTNECVVHFYLDQVNLGCCKVECELVHSRFKILFNVDESSMCPIYKQYALAQLI